VPTTKFEIADYDLAVEPWSPIERRVVVRSTGEGDGDPDEATLLFTKNRTETGVVHGVDGPGGVSLWAYFEKEEYDDVLHLLETGTATHLHYGYVSGDGGGRSLYFLSVETTASAPGSGDGVEESLPIGEYEPDESLDLPVDQGAVERVRDRRPEHN
jgi:hypothetical protein